ncbi:uncharacterized protein VICG_00640 [Vittaforma corneae ATCC 50505]|uniref:Uncharacterized protein n=1 Tax=Vittaforma corneae (strain ATCC 50505) TaxID=993615 RepID=L2GN37_VITCO|nr:uncharacterized protein VICG_00640 [Vittaforma corneae ATCC 50505]ELA42241.1 hypothetical protein VICG_00640 [Vittaforma corneae ATCC 50505]
MQTESTTDNHSKHCLHNVGVKHRLSLSFSEDINFEKFQIFNIPLKTTYIAVYKNTLLAKCSNTLKIFSFDSNMTLRLLQSHSMCFTSYISQYLPESALTLSYKIMLNLLNDGISFKKAEECLCRLMDELEFDKIAKTQISSNGVLITYKGGNRRYFNSEMDEVSENARVLPANNISVKVSKNDIEVRTNCETVIKRSFGRALKTLSDENLVFLLKEDSLIAIVFDINQ